MRRFESRVAVDDVTFDVRAGEVFGLLGPNSGGKTTTLRMERRSDRCRQPSPIRFVVRSDGSRCASVQGNETETGARSRAAARSGNRPARRARQETQVPELADHSGKGRTFHATFLDRDGLTTNRTATPNLASMSINASVLNKSIRPRRRSLTRGCVTRSTFAAAACVRRLDAMVF